MELIKLKTIHGPNVFHNKPVIISRVDLKDYVDVATDEMPQFVNKLLEMFPGLEEHTCSPGYRGGFIERLHRGTYLAHVTEHIALELSELAGIGVTYGKSVYAGAKGIYDVVTRFENEEGMKACHRAAIRLVQSFLANKEFNLSETVEDIKQKVVRSKMGPSTQAIFDAAVRNKIPCRRVTSNSLLRLGYGKNIRLVQAAVTDQTSNIAVELVQDKALTKQVLKEGAVPVPAGSLVSNTEELNDAIEELYYPIAIKPYDGHHGKGVSVNINNYQEAYQAFQLAKTFSDEVLVEEMCIGKDYRILVIDGKMVAAAERVPPFIVGDGETTVEKLIEITNEDPRRVEGHGGILTKIEVDEGLLQTLEKQRYLLTSIVPANQRVLLRESANLSGGGTAIDVTDIVHPSIKSMSERVAKLVGLDICGLDLIHSDISRPIEDGAKVIEVNAGPGLRMHLAPSEGKARDVGQDIIKMLYPNPADARIPIIGVTGTNGKTSTARMLCKILSQKHECVGLTSSDGIWVGGIKIESGDTSGPISAGKILNDPQVDCAVFELARGGLVRGGLAYDWSDVGIITNIRPDHIGQDGVESVEDLVRIKSLVVERVKEGGTIILNADDPEASKLINHKSVTGLKRNIVLYSMSSTNPLVHKHITSGKDGCWVESGIIYARFNGVFEKIGKLTELPVTIGGLAEFQISNSLAAICGGVAMNITAQNVFRALVKFDPSVENIGRMNLYKIRGSYVILDYGHNSDAFSAVGRMLSSYTSYKKTAIVSLPGDRIDDLLVDSVRAFAPCFDKIVIKEDEDLRGRAPMEITKLVQNVLASEFPEIENVSVAKETQAIESVLSSLTENEIVVVFYDNLSNALRAIRHFDPEPIMQIPMGKEDKQALSNRLTDSSDEDSLSIGLM